MKKLWDKFLSKAWKLLVLLMLSDQVLLLFLAMKEPTLSGYSSNALNLKWMASLRDVLIALMVLYIIWGLAWFRYRRQAKQ